MPSSECAIATCNNYYEKTKGMGISYHRFPKTKDAISRWVATCKRADKFKVENANVCSVHFRKEDYERDLRNELLGIPPRKILRKDAIPSLNLPPGSDQKRMVPSKIDERLAKRQRKAYVKAILESPAIFIENENTQEKFEESLDHNQLLEEAKHLREINACLQRDNNKLLENVKDFEKLKSYYKTLKKENLVMKQNLERYRRMNRMQIKAKFEYVKSILSKIFTPGQIKILLGAKRVVWNSKDLASAIALRTISKKAYIYLKKQMKIPLPGLSTLRRYRSKLSSHPDLQSAVLELMKYERKDLTKGEKNGVFC